MGINQSCYQSLSIGFEPDQSYVAGGTVTTAYGFSYDAVACDNVAGNSLSVEFGLYPVFGDEYPDNYPSTKSYTCDFTFPAAGDDTGTISTFVTCANPPNTVAESGTYQFGTLLRDASGTFVLMGPDKFSNTFAIDITEPATVSGVGRRRNLRLERQQLALLQSGSKLPDQLPNGDYCRPGWSACPIAKGPKQATMAWECLNTLTTLDSCGGCPHMSSSWQDCSIIDYVEKVSCVRGQCLVTACEEGYKIGKDGKTCELEALE